MIKPFGNYKTLLLVQNNNKNNCNSLSWIPLPGNYKNSPLGEITASQN
jgi:hypothetical protein